MAEPAASRAIPKSRLIVFYVALFAITAAAAIFVISSGSDKKGLESIAGGYDAAAPNACLGTPPAKAKGRPLPPTTPIQPVVAGPSFDVKQSGQFVNLSNSQKSIGGKLRFEGSQNAAGARKLTGDVSCTNGKTAKFVGQATTGDKAVISGTLGGQPLAATLKRDPPDAGTPAPRAPGSIASLYKLSPRSTCFGGTFDLASKSGNLYTLKAKNKELGQVTYDNKKGTVAGDVECTKGGAVKMKALAVDRNLNNVKLLPLDVAKPAKGLDGKPRPWLTTPSGLAPGGENFTATRQRESFGHTLASALLAIA
ncbi:MAG: hypothetical protein QOJ12_3011, partial [Thermoleophilales bacterium]|nr:hypothetical protein [Thermoleophilales bacterium]